MPRRVQDIVPGDHRSIRSIPVERGTRSEIKKSTSSGTSKRQTKTHSKVHEEPAPEPKAVVHETSHHEHHHSESISINRQPLITTAAPARKRGSGSGLWWTFVTIGVLAVVIGAGYIASVYFSRATFTVVPRSIPLSVSGTYVAQGTPAAGALLYELVVVQSTASTTVPATDSAVSTTKAEGSVTLYNTYSPEPQRLIAGTRLANDSGLIYKTTESVTIPGYTKSSSGQILAGTAKADIVADQAGPSYNISKTDSISDFRVVAFKSTPRYSGFYARLASDVNGGFNGTKKNVAAGVLASTTELLRSTLNDALVKKAKESIPNGYISYDAGFIPSFTAATIGGNDPKVATISIKGTVYGILFKEESLVAKLAGNQADPFKDYDYEAVGLKDLQFSIANIKEFSPEKKNTLIARLTGGVELVGSIPEEELKAKLAGMDLADTQKVFSSYSPIIKTGSGELVPPWSKVPMDQDRINIVVDQQ